MIPPPSDELPQWLEYIRDRTEGSPEDATALSKGEIRYLFDCYLGYEKAFEKGIANLDIPYAEPGTPLAIAAVANTLLKVEIASLRERLSEKKESPALGVQYEVAQRQIALLEKDKEELLHTSRFHRNELVRLHAQIEERDRALANQIEAFRQQKEKADYLQTCGERNTELIAELRVLQTAFEAQIAAYDNSREEVKTLREQLVVALQDKGTFSLGGMPQIITHATAAALLLAAKDAGHGPLMVGGDCLREALERIDIAEEKTRVAQAYSQKLDEILNDIREQHKNAAEAAARYKERVEGLEKKLTRLTGLAEDLVQEASEA